MVVELHDLMEMERAQLDPVRQAKVKAACQDVVEQWEQDSFKERTNEMLQEPRNDWEKEAKDPRMERAKELEEETGTDVKTEESDPCTECDKVVLLEKPGSDLETEANDPSSGVHKGGGGRSVGRRRQTAPPQSTPRRWWKMLEKNLSLGQLSQPFSGKSPCEVGTAIRTGGQCLLGCEPCGARLWRDGLATPRIA